MKKVKLVIIAVLGLILGTRADEETDHLSPLTHRLLLSVEATRHGERGPGKLFNFAADPNQEFKEEHKLTRKGVFSQYANGLAIRELFDKHKGFLKAEYDPDEIYVQTTWKERTIESAKAQLDGLYGNNEFLD